MFVFSLTKENSSQSVAKQKQPPTSHEIIRHRRSYKFYFTTELRLRPHLNRYIHALHRFLFRHLSLHHLLLHHPLLHHLLLHHTQASSLTCFYLQTSLEEMCCKIREVTRAFYPLVRVSYIESRLVVVEITIKWFYKSYFKLQQNTGSVLFSSFCFCNCHKSLTLTNRQNNFVAQLICFVFHRLEKQRLKSGFPR